MIIDIAKKKALNVFLVLTLGAVTLTFSQTGCDVFDDGNSMQEEQAALDLGSNDAAGDTRLAGDTSGSDNDTDTNLDGPKPRDTSTDDTGNDVGRTRGDSRSEQTSDPDTATDTTTSSGYSREDVVDQRRGARDEATTGTTDTGTATDSDTATSDAPRSRR